MPAALNGPQATASLPLYDSQPLFGVRARLPVGQVVRDADGVKGQFGLVAEKIYDLYVVPPNHTGELKLIINEPAARNYTVTGQLVVSVYEVTTQGQRVFNQVVTLSEGVTGPENELIVTIPIFASASNQTVRIRVGAVLATTGVGAPAITDVPIFIEGTLMSTGSCGMLSNRGTEDMLSQLESLTSSKIRSVALA